MFVKTFWLFVCMMVCSSHPSYNFDKKKLCYVGVPIAVSVVLLIFFGYRYMHQRPLLKRIGMLDRDMKNYLKNFIIINEAKEMYARNFSKQITYPMSLNMDSPEGLLYPINLNANFLVKQTFVGQTNPNNLVPKNGDPSFIDTQWWVRKHDKIIRLSIDTIAANCYIHCILPEDLVIAETVRVSGANLWEPLYVDRPNDFKEHFMMDNKNANDCVVIGAVSSDKKKSAIYADKIDVQFDVETNAEMKPRCILNGLLLTVMMHPHKDIIAYSFRQEEQDKENEKGVQYEIHIVENVCSAKQDNTIELQPSPFDYYSSVDFGIKKITPFGGSTYLFLTLNGELGMCWPTKNEQNEQDKNIIEWLLKKHKSTFIDFTPDTSCVTKTGFMPHWAFLSDQGEIFWCDFLLPLHQTTLFFVKQAEPCKNSMHEKFDKIYYKDGHCGVLYKKMHSFGKDVPYTKLICYS